MLRSTTESAEAYDRWLDVLEGLGEVERWVSAAWVGGRDVPLPEDELNEALRRALVVRAVGGSPQREVTLEEEAVLRLADELDSPDRRAALSGRLATLRERMDSPAAVAALDALLADGDLAWRCFAAGRLAAEVG
jgi:hypothetical protein